MLINAALFLALSPLFAFAQVTEADIQTFLQAHNTVRSRYDAPPLMWDAKLASYAQNAAAKCATSHSGGPYGENLAWGTASSYSIAALVKMWADEAADYDPTKPDQQASLHFTQLVWKATTYLGCGVQICESNRVVFCEYDPPGNVEGQYSENVGVPSIFPDIPYIPPK